MPAQIVSAEFQFAIVFDLHGLGPSGLLRACAVGGEQALGVPKWRSFVRRRVAVQRIRRYAISPAIARFSGDADGGSRGRFFAHIDIRVGRGIVPCFSVCTKFQALRIHQHWIAPTRLLLPASGHRKQARSHPQTAGCGFVFPHAGAFAVYQAGQLLLGRQAPGFFVGAGSCCGQCYGFGLGRGFGLAGTAARAAQSLYALAPYQLGLAVRHFPFSSGKSRVRTRHLDAGNAGICTSLFGRWLTTDHDKMRAYHLPILIDRQGVNRQAGLGLRKLKCARCRIGTNGVIAFELAERLRQYPGRAQTDQLVGSDRWFGAAVQRHHPFAGLGDSVVGHFAGVGLGRCRDFGCIRLHRQHQAHRARAGLQAIGHLAVTKVKGPGVSAKWVVSARRSRPKRGAGYRLG